MCKIFNIMKNEHNFMDLYANRYNSILDYTLYRNFVIYLSIKCKCSDYKFNRQDWINN